MWRDVLYSEVQRERARERGERERKGEQRRRFMLETSEEELFSERRLGLTSSGCSPPLQPLNVTVSSLHTQSRIFSVVDAAGCVLCVTDNVTEEVTLGVKYVKLKVTEPDSQCEVQGSTDKMDLTRLVV